MLILVINCGSSSVKYELFDVGTEVPLCGGSVERIGDNVSLISHSAGVDKAFTKDIDCPDHHKALEMIRDVLTDARYGVLSDVGEVSGVGHRVVHGGEKFSSSILIDQEVIDSIESFSELAPLHNPPSLEGIRSCEAIFTGVPQVAVFDTAFHQTMPEKAFTYGIPYEFYKKYGIRKYGFHGTSHRYVSEKAAEILKRPADAVDLITVHLGNGCSIAAVKKGKSVDTSMGYTPLEGLVMGTRSGDMDPAVVTYLMRKEKMNTEDMDAMLNKKSGLLGVSGISNDMRDILSAISDNSRRAALAYEMFVYRIIKYIGSYAAVMGNVDAVVFTAGIGENVPGIKEQVESHLRGFLGGSTKFLVVSTNEELLIARDTYEVVRKKL